ncbi:GNAT family N-acetyltransferase [Chloroflexi bacterium TSY]|nr:GNAT family N-acetyltransferase [Chloroflexi bacterium TSY]
MGLSLQGKHVKLRPLVTDDESTIKQWRSDFALKRLTGPGAYLPSRSEQINIASSDSHIPFGIVLIETDRLIGEISLSHIDWSNRVAELGISIGEKECQGKGLGTEALELFIEYSFRELNLHRIELGVVDYNIRAIKSYEKLGFQLEGRLREYAERDYHRYDLLLFGLLRDEWKNR